MERGAQILRRNRDGSSVGIHTTGEFVEATDGAWTFAATIGPVWIPTAGERLDVVFDHDQRRGEALLERLERGTQPREWSLRLIGVGPLRAGEVGYVARPEPG